MDESNISNNEKDISINIYHPFSYALSGIFMSFSYCGCSCPTVFWHELDGKIEHVGEKMNARDSEKPL